MEKLKVFGLMTVLSVLLVALGGYVGGNAGAAGFFLFSLATNAFMYWKSDKLVLRQYRAQIIEPGSDGGRYDELYSMVDRLRQRAGLPMPVVAVAAQQQPNAFATGRNPEHAVVCVTQGMWNAVKQGYMGMDELEGVMAHELAHVKNHHMLVGTIAASLAGAVMLVGSMLRWGAIFGGFGGRDRRDGNGLEMLALAILAPVAAMIVQMAISRRNEFVADADGARISGKPLSLAHALEKIEGIAKNHPMEVAPSVAPLAIINPLGALGGFASLFRTHPPTEERVARLQQLAAREDLAALTR
jgi:heat shock protein HtpX